MKISVVIQTYNSEQFLERVLNSVKEFDEIVAVSYTHLRAHET